MGWTFIDRATRAQIIQECIGDKPLVGGGILRTLRKALRGNVMYVLLEQERQGKVTRKIGVTLLEKSPEGWGYKEMEEADFPYYFDCPLKFLDDACPPETEEAARWRRAVRERAEEMASKRPAQNETWSLIEGCTPSQVLITQVRPLRGTAEGKTYRIPRKLLDKRVG